MESFGARIARGDKPLILDGGLATELERRGFDVSGTLWSAGVLLEAPEAIEQLHVDYFAAGAACVISASYQASYEGYGEAGIPEDDTTALLTQSVALAQRARDRAGPGATQRYVAASVGPFGATRHDGSEYHGDYGLSVDELIRFHERRFAVLAGSGADVLACETIPSLDEVWALMHLLGDHPASEAWVSCTSPDGLRTAHGEALRDVAKCLDDIPSVVAVGVNCLPPDHVLTAIGELRRGTAKPIVVYPNSGEHWDAVARSWTGNPGTWVVELADKWYAAGARVIGGCCRIGPGTIEALARRLPSG
jgi:homocysteine S-methyltransferase